jgi:glycosyltransferase involved in cell wall biosynthesis
LIRLAFTAIDPRLWTGGYNYLLNLFQVLHRHQPGRIGVVLFQGEDGAESQTASFREIGGVEVVRSPVFDASRKAGSLLASLMLGKDPRAQAAFREHGIEAVFEVARFFGARLGIPAIAWMADFQHRALPEAFTAAGRMRRDLGFRAQVAAGRDIMLSSADARDACERYYPRAAGRTHVVRFAVPPAPPATFDEARRTADGYGLPNDFFFMPNQFWRHKNHLLVAQALAILRSRGLRPVIAASGKQMDARDAGHFPRLKAAIEELGVASEFRLLGMIPYAHLALLMQASSALLNPSLFEGWSTTVEEARSAGVPMILSDLAVHREQAGERASYFDRDDPAALADALQAFAPLGRAARDQAAAAARADAEARVEQFAANFAALVDQCVARRRP